MTPETQLILPEAFKTEIASIDAQHASLVEKLNECVAANDGTDFAKFTANLEEFLAELHTHFEHEEKIMRDAVYPGVDRHAAHHQGWLTELQALLDDCTRRGTATEEDVVIFFRRLIEDAARADLKFVEYLWDAEIIGDFKAR